MSTRKKASLCIIVCCVFMAGISTVALAEVVEPNDIIGESYFSSGTTESSTESPSWQIVVNRHSTDNYKHLYLIVELDTTQIIAYDVNNIQQSSPYPITFEMEKDDLVIVWDEDPEHGEKEEFKAFTYTNDAYIADPNCDYVRVSTTDDNDIINWMVYQMEENGTLTITNTGNNEHDVIRLYRNHIDFSKVDDVNDLDCRSPGDEITYTICWDNTGVYSYENCFIIDYLPEGVDYPDGADHYVFDGNSIQFVEGDPGYNADEHYYVWELGTIAPGDANCVTLDVVVNEKAEPGFYLHNVAELWANDGNSLIARATEDTLVCCWDIVDPNLIYVDKTATGFENGTTWEDAYTDLADAIERATTSVCQGPYTIYVAQGTYDPNNTPNKSFVLPDNVLVYGGFCSGGCDFSERDPRKYKTILTGQLDDDTDADADTVVTMGDETLLDGFKVTKSVNRAIYGDGVAFNLENCIIEDNDSYGILSKDGDAVIKWCRVQLNNLYGIYHRGEGFELIVENSWILRNGGYGIFCLNSTPMVKNSIISESDLAQEGRQGIRLINPTNVPVLYNNTIANNSAEGVFFISSDPNYLKNGDYLDMQNCIVYYNNGGGNQLLGIDPDNTAYYCCIQDCNEVNSNINNDPEFAYTIDPNGTPDPNNYHLAYDSICMEKGNPFLSYTDQVDIDGEGIDRKYGSYVDIGADEVYSCDEPLTEDDIYNPLDWNADGVVNYIEFNKFSRAWLSRDPNDPSITDPNLVDPNDLMNWNPTFNLITTGDSAYMIDLADLEDFIENTPWLWEACWRDNYVAIYGMMSGGGGESMVMSSPMLMSIDSTIAKSTEEETKYTDMPNSELALLVKSIYEIIDHLEIRIEEDGENAENALEMKDFLENVLNDIKASRK